jgi:hypothetical protein
MSLPRIAQISFAVAAPKAFGVARIFATLIGARYHESPAHDVNGENAALMAGEKIIDEVADD